MSGVSIRRRAVFDSLLSMYRLIPSDFRLEFFGIVASSFVVAAFELIGIASVLPLIGLMVNPGALASSRLLGPLLRGIGQTAMPSIGVLGFFVIGLFLLTNAVTLLVQWWSTRFSASLAGALSRRLATAHFAQPFTFFLAHPAAELAHKACNEVGLIASSGILQLCLVVVRLVILVIVALLLLALSPLFGATLFSMTAILYALIYRYSARHMDQLGTKAMVAASCATTAATEMYAAAREILLKGDCRIFIERVSAPFEESRRAETISRILPTLPKYAIEVAAVCAIFSVPLYRSYMGQDVRPDLPVLATFAYAGFRLLPIAQQFYASLTLVRFYVPMAKQIDAMLSAAVHTQPVVTPLAHVPAIIAFDSIGFVYPNAEASSVSSVSFEIARGERVALVGDSGAGKSTVVDLILGLLTPSTGAIRLDGGARCVRGLAWKTGLVGYVPQSPLVLDDSIAKNIAFGAGQECIDYDRCREAARKAGILDVIEKQARGFDTVLGSRGVNFSGGERQRLAIARAYYARPELLVLDEPGSALDPPMSRRVFEGLCARDREDTVLVVTHDLEHLTLFDKIIFMRRGRVLMTGRHDELIARCSEFRNFQGEVIARKTKET